MSSEYVTWPHPWPRPWHVLINLHINTLQFLPCIFQACSFSFSVVGSQFSFFLSLFVLVFTVSSFFRCRLLTWIGFFQDPTFIKTFSIHQRPYWMRYQHNKCGVKIIITELKEFLHDQSVERDTIMRWVFTVYIHCKVTKPFTQSWEFPYIKVMFQEAILFWKVCWGQT